MASHPPGHDLCKQIACFEVWFPETDFVSAAGFGDDRDLRAVFADDFRPEPAIYARLRLRGAACTSQKMGKVLLSMGTPAAFTSRSRPMAAMVTILTPCI